MSVGPMPGQSIEKLPVCASVCRAAESRTPPCWAKLLAGLGAKRLGEDQSRQGSRVLRGRERQSSPDYLLLRRARGGARTNETEKEKRTIASDREKWKEKKKKISLGTAFLLIVVDQVRNEPFVLFSLSPCIQAVRPRPYRTRRQPLLVPFLWYRSLVRLLHFYILLRYFLNTAVSVKYIATILFMLGYNYLQ